MQYSRSNRDTLQKSAPITPISWALSMSKSGSMMSAEMKYFFVFHLGSSHLDLPSKPSLKKNRMLPAVQAVNMILESFEKVKTGTVSSWIPLITFLRTLSWPKMQIMPVSSVVAITLPSGANMQFRMASPPGWYKTSVFSPVPTSHKITQPSTLDDAITEP